MWRAMAGDNVFTPSPEEHMEVYLFFRIYNSSLDQYKGLLRTLGDIDVRGIRQKTLLHLGVYLGKLDWVEGLLREGADPCLRDGNQVTAVEMAEEMSRRYPEEGDRKDILRLIHLVYKREDAVKSQSTSTPQRCSQRLPRALLHGVDVAGASLASPSHKMAELSSLKQLMNALKTKMSSLGHWSVEELRKELSDRDVLLECLESAVRSSVEDLRAMKERLDVISGEESARGLALPKVEDMRLDCIDTMMGMTTILNCDEGKVSFVRGLYEKIYNEGELTSCLLVFLKSQSQVNVMVDCDLNNIGKMKSIVTDLDGFECNGSDWSSFADFSDFKVYLGGKIGTDEAVAGQFARILAQMAILLAFENRRKSYERSNGFLEEEFERALYEVEKNRERTVEFDWRIKFALDWKTQHAKLIELASAVPWIIAHEGWMHGTSLLRKQVPFLLDFFEVHVMGMLLDKARVIDTSEYYSDDDFENQPPWAKHARAMKVTAANRAADVKDVGGLQKGSIFSVKREDLFRPVLHSGVDGSVPDCFRSPRKRQRLNSKDEDELDTSCDASDSEDEVSSTADTVILENMDELDSVGSSQYEPMSVSEGSTISDTDAMENTFWKVLTK